MAISDTLRAMSQEIPLADHKSASMHNIRRRVLCRRVQRPQDATDAFIVELRIKVLSSAMVY